MLLRAQLGFWARLMCYLAESVGFTAKEIASTALEQPVVLRRRRQPSAFVVGLEN
jgi:hypothetical protein